MTDSVSLKAGDTSPPARGTLKDGDGNPANLTDATARFLLRDAFTGLAILSEEADIDADPTSGRVSYPWQPGDTDIPGVYRGEFEITFEDAEIESFPDGAYVDVVIEPKSGPLPGS
jgi:hypothetical protein